MFTENIPYRDIFNVSIDVSFHISLLFQTLALLINELKNKIADAPLIPNKDMDFANQYY